MGSSNGELLLRGCDDGGIWKLADGGCELGRGLVVFFDVSCGTGDGTNTACVPLSSMILALFVKVEGSNGESVSRDTHTVCIFACLLVQSAGIHGLTVVNMLIPESLL